MRALLAQVRISNAVSSFNKLWTTKVLSKSRAAKLESNKNEPNFNGVYPMNNLPKIKDGAYVINLNEYKSIGTHWIVLYVNAENVTYFDSFEVEHMSNKI